MCDDVYGIVKAVEVVAELDFGNKNKSLHKDGGSLENILFVGGDIKLRLS